MKWYVYDSFSDIGGGQLYIFDTKEEVMEWLMSTVGEDYEEELIFEGIYIIKGEEVVV